LLWRRWDAFCVFLCLLAAGCGSSSNSVPGQAPSSPGPPAVLGRGSIAVLAVPRGTGKVRIVIFPPGSDKVARELPVPTRPNSIAFARHDRLFYGFDGGHDEFFVREVNVTNGERLRSLVLKPSWFASSVATDDYNVLYVNTKSLVGGDVKLFQPGHDKPYLEIKDPLRPTKIAIARDSLWVGYSGALSDGLARYDVRSKKQTWFRNTGSNLPVGFAANPDGSLIAARVLGNHQGAVIVYDTKQHKSTKIHEGESKGLASDDSGNLYIAQKSGRILTCTFTGCDHSFETNLEIQGVAWNPRDGMLYVPASGSSGNGVYVYDPRTTSLVRVLPVKGNEYAVMISIEG
jgi:WD40 repeat protein